MACYVQVGSGIAIEEEGMGSRRPNAGSHCPGDSYEVHQAGFGRKPGKGGTAIEKFAVVSVCQRADKRGHEVTPTPDTTSGPSSSVVSESIRQ